MVATVYYLNWDEESVEPELRDFFSKLSLSSGEEFDTVPREWYRELTTVDIDDPEEIFTVFQGDVRPSMDAPDEIQEARQNFTQLQTRSMSPGDVIETDSRVILVCGLGTKDVEWGTSSDIEL